MSDASPLRLLILGAHPDDADFSAGGLAARYCALGHVVKMVSVTDGGAGHHERAPEELRRLRTEEAAAAGRVIGATYEVWPFPDGELEPTLEVRRRIIREIRTFQPDLVLTHRISDYHPDHRAVGQAVQDASYLVTVPPICPDVPAIFSDPVVAYMADLFDKPCPLEADVVLDVTDQVDTISAMLACHTSQFFEWLAYEEGVLDTVPPDTDIDARRAWTRAWYARHAGPRADRFRDALVTRYGETRGRKIEFAEVYEISEYAGSLTPQRRRQLFLDTDDDA